MRPFANAVDIIFLFSPLQGFVYCFHLSFEIVAFSLRALLPDPASLGSRTKGKTWIGCQVSGVKNGEKKTVTIYNICDHQECYKEIQSQAISYTTGVPSMIGAKLMITGVWRGQGVFNMEQFDPDPFMDELNRCGLPWKVVEQAVIDLG